MWVCSSSGHLPPGSPCLCDFRCRIAKVTKGGGRPHFVIKNDKDTKLLHTLTCTSTAKPHQKFLRILPEIQAAVAACKKVTAKEVEDWRSEHKCLSTGEQQDGAAGRQSRRVAQYANSTTGAGAGNLWGQLGPYVEALQEANPGCTVRIKYAPQVDGEPQVVIYIFIQFTSALKCVVGHISLEVCPNPFPPLSSPAAPDSVNLSRFYHPCLQIVGMDAAVTKGRSLDAAQVFLMGAITGDNRNIPLAFGTPLPGSRPGVSTRFLGPVSWW